MSAEQASPWGFHRLRAEWAERVVEAARIRPGELVIDVGAGTGALTEVLRTAGARVIAIELHPTRAGRLRERFAADPAVSVLTLDARDFRWPSRPVRVVANPPFAIIPDLIGALRRHRSTLSADLVLPQRVVRRRVARGDRRLQTRSGLELPRAAFDPRPPMPCAVLQLRKTR